MDGNIPKEIQEKLEIIKKEMDFSNRMKPPKRINIWLAIIVFAAGIMNIFNHGSFYEIAFLFLLGVMNITGYFEHKKLFQLHSNACDIITYYKNRDAET